jgi:hypothetical protein
VRLPQGSLDVTEIVLYYYSPPPLYYELTTAT